MIGDRIGDMHLPSTGQEDCVFFLTSFSVCLCEEGMLRMYNLVSGMIIESKREMKIVYCDRWQGKYFSFSYKLRRMSLCR